MLKAYEYCLLPTEKQKQQPAKFFGSVRFVYNLGLEIKLQAWASAPIHVTCIDLANRMKGLKDSQATWLLDRTSPALQMSWRNLDDAYTQFFRGGGFPECKSKHHKQSIQLLRGMKTDFENNTIFLPKLQNVTCIFYRSFKDEMKTVNISGTSTGKYFISILIENQKELPVKKPVRKQTTVGIDMDEKTFCTFSDGTSFDNPSHLRNNLRRFWVEQRKWGSRCKKALTEQSQSYQKQNLAVAKLHNRSKTNVMTIYTKQVLQSFVLATVFVLKI